MKAVKGMDDLATKSPEIALEWSPRNVLGADEVYWRHQKKYWLICQECGYEREQNLFSRVVQGRGCAACAGRVVVAGLNDLESQHPDIAKEWSPKNSLRADEVVCKAHKEFWFICPECGYEREQSLYKRVIKGQGCSACSGHAFVPGINDLETKAPELIKEWSCKNTKAPKEVYWRTTEEYWLICQDCGYERKQSLKGRAHRYVVGNQREHKFNYRIERFKADPQLVYKEGLTETQLARINKLPRIWDAGKTKYVLKGEK